MIVIRKINHRAPFIFGLLLVGTVLIPRVSFAISYIRQCSSASNASVFETATKDLLRGFSSSTPVGCSCDVWSDKGKHCKSGIMDVGGRLEDLGSGRHGAYNIGFGIKDSGEITNKDLATPIGIVNLLENRLALIAGRGVTYSDDYRFRISNNSLSVSHKDYDLNRVLHSWSFRSLDGIPYPDGCAEVSMLQKLYADYPEVKLVYADPKIVDLIQKNNIQFACFSYVPNPTPQYSKDKVWFYTDPSYAYIIGLERKEDSSVKITRQEWAKTCDVNSENGTINTLSFNSVNCSKEFNNLPVAKTLFSLFGKYILFVGIIILALFLLIFGKKYYGKN